MSRASTEALGGELGLEDNIGQRPNEEFPHVNIVTDAQSDVAKTEQLDKIVVGVPGRKILQQIFVRKSGSGTGGKTSKTYNPEEDAPKKPLSILPTKEEIESRAETLEFLVVGIVLATNPLQYSTKSSGIARNRQRDADRVARGILPAESNILRAVVPITDFLPSGSIKYYVACQPLHGLCNLRLISSDAIFYFQEIWDGIQDNIGVKERRRQLGTACKMQAARDKRPPQRALIPVSVESNSTLSNSISITPATNAANLLLMQYSMYAVSQQPSELAALQRTLENILPDLLSRPSNEGILGFYDFENALGEEDAIKAIEAVMVCVELVTLFHPL
jgi:hypothetical protein